MKNRYMVFWKPAQKPDERYISLIPEEVRAAEALKKKGSIIEDWIAADRSKGWLLMQAESKNELFTDLKTLPLYPFLLLEITDLFSPESR